MPRPPPDVPPGTAAPCDELGAGTVDPHAVASTTRSAPVTMRREVTSCSHPVDRPPPLVAIARIGESSLPNAGDAVVAVGTEEIRVRRGRVVVVAEVFHG